MGRNFLVVILISIVGLLGACTEENDLDGLKMLDVQFEVPETAEVGETVTLKAIVDYGDDPVTDAQQMEFEVWERGERDDGDWIEGDNHEDGTYTTELTFDQDGIFEMYAHTTAHDLHDMPKKEIVIGEGGDYEDVEEDGFLTEGFDMNFSNPEETQVETPTELKVQLFMHDDLFEDAEVRYEIWNHEVSEKHDWIDADETTPGEYVTEHTFPEEGTYHIQIHVEDDEDLHEHETHDIEVVK